MRADATGTHTVKTRKALGAGLVVSVLAALLFAVATVPMLDGGASVGYVAAAIALSIASGIVAAVNAALLLEPASVRTPVDAGSLDLAA